MVSAVVHEGGVEMPSPTALQRRCGVHLPSMVRRHCPGDVAQRGGLSHASTELRHEVGEDAVLRQRLARRGHAILHDAPAVPEERRGAGKVNVAHAIGSQVLRQAAQLPRRARRQCGLHRQEVQSERRPSLHVAVWEEAVDLLEEGTEHLLLAPGASVEENICHCARAFSALQGEEVTQLPGSPALALQVLRRAESAAHCQETGGGRAGVTTITRAKKILLLSHQMTRQNVPSTARVVYENCRRAESETQYSCNAWGKTQHPPPTYHGNALSAALPSRNPRRSPCTQGV